ncbi:MAG: 16S rRNA (guanine(527)-N(7))-methyltransferase RsmG [Bacteroidales bacterium]|nr:16S rRNA (guanine(527)-N(7))-methyltransferase RsmG [Bacteroidales bacterium]
MNVDIITKYFPSLSDKQIESFRKMKSLYEVWNSRINVISRKDVDFYTRHVLHSLSIAKVIDFVPSTTVLDVGTGGGFPGIPLAILFPEVRFTLLDSIEKKIKVTSAIAEELELSNITTVRKRFEEEENQYDFIVSRAVMDFKKFIKPASKTISKNHQINTLSNGIFLLKGGDIDEELGNYKSKTQIFNISDFFSEEFFETKKVVYYAI